MAVNPKSLKNLKPGARKGVRQKATKGFIELLVEGLQKRLPNAFQMLDDLEQLSPKEYLAAYIKLVEKYCPAPIAEKPEEEKQDVINNFQITLHGESTPKPLLDLTQMQNYAQPQGQLITNEPPTSAEVIETKAEEPRAKKVQI